MRPDPIPPKFETDQGARDAREESAIQCFTIRVGNELFGLPVDCVQTIFQIGAVTPVPLGPREVVGLANLRGKIVTAVSLRRRLKMEDLPELRSRPAVGIEYHGEHFALIVDDVGDVIFLHPGDQIPIPPHLNEQRTSLTEAVYRLDHAILSLLDIGAVFELERRILPGSVHYDGATSKAG